MDNIPSKADGNETRLIVNRLGGDLRVGAATAGTLFGLLYDDSENVLSLSIAVGCQYNNSPFNLYPRLVRIETFIPSGRSGWLGLSALGVTGGYYGAIVAMRAGEISVVAPFRYTAMLFALMWGFLIFGEVPDQITWAGIAIVVIAGVYTFHRESVRKREAASAAGDVR